MTQRHVETLAGLFLLLGLAAITFLAARVAGDGLGGGEGVVLKAEFSNASGLKAGSRVEVAGVRVGEVRSLELRPETFRALVTFTVAPGLEFHDDTIAAIKSNGLLGDKSLVLKPGGSGIVLAPGDVIVDTESSVDLESLISKVAFGGLGGGSGGGQPASPQP